MPPICHQAFLLPSSLTNDLQEVASSYQLYASLIAGAEAVVHAIKTSFLWDDTEARVVLLVGASNAFNSHVVH